MPGQQRVHRVAGRAGHVAHQHPLVAQQPIHERRLTDVGPADNGDVGLFRGERLGIGEAAESPSSPDSLILNP